MKKYDFYSDPGHGWMKVNRSELKKLGIEDKITSFSYQKGNYVYLEEDCDCTTFSQAMWEKFGISSPALGIIQHHTNQESEIRNYEHYKKGASHEIRRQNHHSDRTGERERGKNQSGGVEISAR